jgi:hypothetical protein
MKEYVIKMNQVEAEALTYCLGGQTRRTPVLTTKMYKTLFKSVFDDDRDLYFAKRLKHSDTFHFKGF